MCHGSIIPNSAANRAEYTLSGGGSYFRQSHSALSMQVLGDTLVDVKFSGLSWNGNEGFYYSSYEKPKGSELSAKTDQHK
ncbi:MAG: S9 family peptidase, partial [Candidatus Sericytochromatia bacterium]